MVQTKCLVVGSCTGQKDDEGCPEELKLTEADFGTTANLLKAEHRAKDWMKPAGKMYTGRQHGLMMNGVKHLRAYFDAASFDVAIVSAGYGLISEERLIAPYNITFQGKGLPWVRERGKTLKLPEIDARASLPVPDQRGFAIRRSWCNGNSNIPGVDSGRIVLGPTPLLRAPESVIKSFFCIRSTFF